MNAKLWQDGGFRGAVLKSSFRLLSKVNDMAREARKLRLDALNRDQIAEDETLRKNAKMIELIAARLDRIAALKLANNKLDRVLRQCQFKTACASPEPRTYSSVAPGLPGETLTRLHKEFETNTNQLLVDGRNFSPKGVGIAQQGQGMQLSASPDSVLPGEMITLSYELPACMAKNGEFAFQRDLVMDERDVESVKASLGQPSGPIGSLTFTAPGPEGAADFINLYDRRTGYIYPVSVELATNIANEHAGSSHT